MLRTPHPVRVILRHNQDYIGILLYIPSRPLLLQGRGGLLMLLGFGALGGLGFRAPGVRVWGSGFACGQDRLPS